MVCPQRMVFDMRNGTWLVETIGASGHVCRVNRPDTRLHLTKYNYFKKVLAKREPSAQDKFTTDYQMDIYSATRLENLFVPSVAVIS